MNEFHELERQVRRWLERGLGPRWVIAVSGGGDSVALLRVLCRIASEGRALELSVAHLDHGTRGEGSRADAAFVAELAASLGLPFDLGHWRPERAHHLETDARRARYEWLADVARARGAHAVAVGHTRDDQIETVLHRIVRGAGLRGLAGMPRRRALADGPPPIALVRPLLDVSRAAARSHLNAIGQAHREDPTNDDRSRTRSRIRHDLLPKLRSEYNPRIDDALFRLGEFAAVGQRAVESSVRGTERDAVISSSENAVLLKHDVARSVPGPERVELLRRAWRGAGWPEGSMTARRWKRLADLVAAPMVPPTDVGAGIAVSAMGGVLSLHRARGASGRHSELKVESPASRPAPFQLPAPVPVSVPVPGEALVPWAPGRIALTVRHRGPGGGALDFACDRREEAPGSNRASDREALDLDRLFLPLIVRAPMAGDRFGPLGMDGKSMPLGAFLRGRRLSIEERGRVPLLCDRQGIVWAIGHRIADRAKLDRTTQNLLEMTWSPA